MNRSIKLLIGIGVPVLLLLLPREVFPFESLTVQEQRMIALFVFAIAFYVLEPIPIFATSTVVIVLELLVMSDKGIKFLRPADAKAGVASGDFGNLLNYREVMGNFADPIIMLFLGGFFLGAAATKYRLDVNLGRVMMRPFGNRTPTVMLGMMVITAVFSMFMSNTATTAMMLAVLMPVLKAIDVDDPARIGFALAIPFAANVGGIGTPIGTPPNAVGLKYLTDASGAPMITFGQWMLFAVPYVIVLLLATWLLLVFMFKPRSSTLNVNFQGRWMTGSKAWIVYITSALTILLWLVGAGVHGMSSTVVAMIPVAVFVAAGIINSQDLKDMGWDVLWLMAGGFALGMGLQKTGLDATLIEAIPFDTMPAVVIILLACAVTFIMANFMSHTATANLIMPLMASLAVSDVIAEGLQPYGGKMALLLAVTFTASLSQSLPISTPPNAMAYATGWVKTKDMARSGLPSGLLGLALLAAMLFILNSMGVLR